jgi:ABC-type phosphate transport system permease subunit
MLNNKKNKKAQVGESITWIIATIILVVILIIFIYASVALSKTKSFNSDVKEKLTDSVDWINSKTEMAYSINDNGKNRIQTWISQSQENE